MNQLIKIYEDFDRKINIKREYRTLIQDIQLFIKFYLNFIYLDNIFALNDNILLIKLFDKLIKRLKNLYDIYKIFIMLKDAKKHLFKLNNNQRINYHLRMFKATFIRIIIKLTKKSFIIIITTLITYIIFIIEIIYILIVKLKQEINIKLNTKKFMCYIYNKIDYYRKDYIV